MHKCVDGRRWLNAHKSEGGVEPTLTGEETWMPLVMAQFPPEVTVERSEAGPKDIQVILLMKTQLQLVGAAEPTQAGVDWVALVMAR